MATTNLSDEPYGTVTVVGADHADALRDIPLVSDARQQEIDARVFDQGGVTDAFVNEHQEQSTEGGVSGVEWTLPPDAAEPSPSAPGNEGNAPAKQEGQPAQGSNKYSGEGKSLDSTIANLAQSSENKIKRQVHIALGDAEAFRRFRADLADQGNLNSMGSPLSAEELSKAFHKSTHKLSEERSFVNTLDGAVAEVATKRGMDTVPGASGNEGTQSRPQIQVVSLLKVSFEPGGSSLRRMMGQRSILQVDAAGTAESLQKEIAETKALAMTLANRGAFGSSPEKVLDARTQIEDHFAKVAAYVKEWEQNPDRTDLRAPPTLHLESHQRIQPALVAASEEYATWKQEQADAKNKGKEAKGADASSVEVVSAVAGEKPLPKFAQALLSDLSEIRANPDLLRTSERIGAVPLIKSMRNLNDEALAQMTPEQRQGVLAQAEALLESARAGELAKPGGLDKAKKEISFAHAGDQSFADKVTAWVAAEKQSDPAFAAGHQERVAEFRAAISGQSATSSDHSSSSVAMDRGNPQPEVVSQTVGAPKPGVVEVISETVQPTKPETVEVVSQAVQAPSKAAPAESVEVVSQVAPEAPKQAQEISGLNSLKDNLAVASDRGFGGLPKRDMETLLAQLDGVQRKPLAQLAGKDTTQQAAFLNQVKNLIDASTSPSQDPELRDQAGALKGALAKWQSALDRATGVAAATATPEKATTLAGDGDLRGAKPAADTTREEVKPPPPQMAGNASNETQAQGPQRYASSAENPAFQALKQLSHTFENPAASFTSGHLTREPRVQWNEAAVQKTLDTIANLKQGDVAQLKAKEIATLSAYADWANRQIKAGTLPGALDDANKDRNARIDQVARTIESPRGISAPVSVSRGLTRADTVTARMTMRTRHTAMGRSGSTRGAGPSLGSSKSTSTRPSLDRDQLRISTELVAAAKQLDTLISSYGKYLVLEAQKLKPDTLDKLDGPSRADAIVAMDQISRHANKGGFGDLSERLQVAASNLQDRANTAYESGDKVELISAHNRLAAARAEGVKLPEMPGQERESPNAGTALNGMRNPGQAKPGMDSPSSGSTRQATADTGRDM